MYDTRPGSEVQQGRAKSGKAIVIGDVLVMETAGDSVAANGTPGRCVTSWCHGPGCFCATAQRSQGRG